MWPFIVFGGLYAIGAAFGRPGRPAPLPWITLFVITVLFVGLRHSVGMDWNNYLRMIYNVDIAPSFETMLFVSEPFYSLLLAIGNWTGWGIYATNLISTFLAMWGVYAFAKRTPEPWLALAAAMPMFIVVVAMSANRQAVAAGLIMLLIAHWERLSLPARTICIVLIAGFHASALIFLAFVAVDLRLPRPVKIVGIGLFSLIAVYILQQSGYGDYYTSAYASGQSELTQSSGAIYHVGVNAIPASLYFLFPRFRDALFPTPLLRNLAFAALLTLPTILLASAAAGRISLYWFPVSMWVWASVPGIVTPRFRRLARLAIAFVMLAIMVGWLSFANSAFAHLPYENALFLPSWDLEIGVLP